MVSLVPEDGITVLEPTPGEGKLVRAAERKGFEVTAPTDFWELKKGYYDAIVMNPPFSPMIEGYRILYACLDRSDHIIALMPWLTLINSEKRTEDLFQFGLESVTHLPRNVFPGARVQTCILELHRGYTGFTEFKQFRRL
jgi:hypothetical protein